jgi:uncharacterized protein (DUF58 family)
LRSADAQGKPDMGGFRSGRLTYLLLLLGGFLFVLIAGGKAAYAFFFVMLALWPICILYLLAAQTGLRFAQVVSSAEVMKEEETLYTFTARNIGSLPLGWVSVSPEDDREVALFGRRFVFSLSPFAHREKTIALKFDYRGLYRVGISRVYVADPFMLSFRALGLRNTPQVLVYPRLFALSRFSPSRFSLLQATKTFSKESDEQASDTRRYAHGDPLNRIHRNLSARQGETITRLFEHESEGHVLCIIDTAPFQADNVPLCEDTLIEACLAVARYVRHLGRRAVIAYASGENIITGDIDDELSFAGILRDLAVLSFNSALSLEELLLKTRRPLYTLAFTAGEVAPSALSADIGLRPLDIFVVKTRAEQPVEPPRTFGDIRIFELNPHDPLAAALEVVP